MPILDLVPPCSGHAVEDVLVEIAHAGLDGVEACRRLHPALVIVPPGGRP